MESVFEVFDREDIKMENGFMLILMRLKKQLIKW